MNQIITHQDLLKYLKKEQIAYQFVDELMSFIQLDIDEGEIQKKEIEKLRNAIKYAQSFEVVNKKDIIDYSSSDVWFNALAKWSQPQDLLILIDDILLLCLSDREKYREICEPVEC